MYSEKFIEKVLSNIDIVDLINNYVKLEKKGENYFGLCPFCEEKTPTFLVSKEKQMFYCFDCGEGGDAISFLMKYKNITFEKSVEMLAEIAKIDLEVTEVDNTFLDSQKKKILDINKEAAIYYYCKQYGKDGSKGREYFDKRKLSKDTLKKFGLGYTDGTLTKHLKDKGFTDDDILLAGLGTMTEKYGVRDKFWNRVMYPIFDKNEKVIGFGGRVLDDSKPKYLNSPETLVFDKSKNLFGLNIAKNTKAPFMIICEGYMDVIAMHQAGFDMAVASLGTAFTTQQAQILKKYTNDVILSYDSDGPGTKATLRGIENLREAGLNGRVLNLKPYKDPDEFIKNEGRVAFEERLKNAKDMDIFEIEQMAKEANENLDSKINFYENIAKKLCQEDFDKDIEI